MLNEIQKLSIKYYKEEVMIKLNDGTLATGSLIGRTWEDVIIKGQKMKALTFITLNNIFGEIEIPTDRIQAIEMYHDL